MPARRRASLLAPFILAAVVVTPSIGSADAGAGYHPSTLLVTFEPGVGPVARAAAHAAIGSRVANRFPEMNLDVVRLPEGLDPRDAVSRYGARTAVASVSLNREVRALGIPNDTLFRDQWGFHNTGQSVTGSFVQGRADVDIDAPEAWDAAFGANAYEGTGGTRVAVLDTGIDRTHADLLNKVKACASATSALGVVVEGSCSDDNFHGTHVAGTVAANTNNGVGVAGTAPNAELAIFKFLNAGGVGFLADEIAALRWAYQSSGARVISMSFGAYEPDDAEQQVIRDAANAGLLLVAAAGNDYDATRNYPAYYTEVMSVASVNAADTISDFSNCNADVEIAAPGEDIWSTFPSNSYGVISGTSMATPHVAGIGALIMSERGTTAEQTRSIIRNTADAVASTGGRSACNGIRRANLAAALGGGSTTPPPPATPGAIAGTVTESGKNKTAIAGATVNCGAAGTATTASNGTYSINDVVPGTYTCTASASGYRSKSSNVTVSSGSTTRTDFALRRG